MTKIEVKDRSQTFRALWITDWNFSKLLLATPVKRRWKWQQTFTDKELTNILDDWLIKGKYIDSADGTWPDTPHLDHPRVGEGKGVLIDLTKPF